MKHPGNWRQQSLAHLENRRLVNPDPAFSGLVNRCLLLEKKPVGDYTESDLRIMIGQQLGLFFLVPLALELLTENLFIEADYYEGDLLSALLGIHSSFWMTHKEWWQTLDQLINRELPVVQARKIDTRLFYTIDTTCRRQ